MQCNDAGVTVFSLCCDMCNTQCFDISRDYVIMVSPVVMPEKVITKYDSHTLVEWMPVRRIESEAPRIMYYGVLTLVRNLSVLQKDVYICSKCSGLISDGSSAGLRLQVVLLYQSNCFIVELSSNRPHICCVVIRWVNWLL